MANPWETGSESDRFRGYLQADGQTLRNKVGANNPTTSAEPKTPSSRFARSPAPGRHSRDV
ncbi:hypothetical protein NKG05_30825 [Oerskovia sp. M15]